VVKPVQSEQLVRLLVDMRDLKGGSSRPAIEEGPANQWVEIQEESGDPVTA